MNQLPIPRVREILEGFEGRRVLILGDVMLDRYLWGRALRISPEAPVPIVETRDQTHRLGGAANVARNIAVMGGRPHLVGVIGPDAEGGVLASVMKEASLSTEGLVTDPDRPTTLKTRVVARSQQIVRADRESRCEITGSALESVLQRVMDSSADADAVIVSDYGKGVITSSLLEHVLPHWRQGGLPVCVDPKESHLMSYRGVTLITPNQAEAGYAYGRRIHDLRTLEEVGLGLLRHLESEAVLMTRGDEGMSLFSRGGSVQHFPTVGTEVFDVTGAGDTVVSTFALALIALATFEEAAVLSNHAAGCVIREVGTAAATREEILASFRNDSGRARSTTDEA